MDMIALIETSLNKKAKMDLLGMQKGDVEKTFADIDYSKEKLDYYPKTSIIEGVSKFIEWYQAYSKV